MNRMACALVLAAGCSSSPTPPEQHLPKQEDSFTLYVSNQSFELDPVDIRIELDGKLAVTGDFEVRTQHAITSFDLGLVPGPHQIRVSTKDVAGVVLDDLFDMDDRKYGIVMFWYYPDGSTEPTPPHFSWTISDEQPLFD
jgi:hypothetical protein